MFLRFKAFQAPLFYEFVDPDTGRHFQNKDIPTLVTEIDNYREQNSLEELEELPLVIENYTCNLPQNIHKCQENKEVYRSFKQYARGGLALLTNMMYGKYVNQAAADLRADQCIHCPFNSSDKKFAGDDIAIHMVGERKATHDELLGHCAVCSCNLKAKVFYGRRLPDFPEEELVQLRKVSCWQLALSGQK